MTHGLSNQTSADMSNSFDGTGGRGHAAIEAARGSFKARSTAVAETPWRGRVHAACAAASSQSGTVLLGLPVKPRTQGVHALGQILPVDRCHSGNGRGIEIFVLKVTFQPALDIAVPMVWGGFAHGLSPSLPLKSG